MEKADEIAWAVESCQDGGIAAKLVVDELLAQRATIERVRALLNDERLGGGELLRALRTALGDE